MVNTDLKVSNATIKNWEKLNVSKFQEKLTRRANKTFSNKNIIPKEYFLNIANIPKVQNIVDELISYKLDISTIIKNLAINLLIKKELISYNESNFSFVHKNLKELVDNFNIIPNKKILNIMLPQDEKDILGIIYQCLLTEGDKNKRGSYYTPQHIIDELTKDICVKEDEKILDPCCGTGSFLLNYNAHPTSIFGFDIDLIAVMIAKVNLIIKYKDIDFVPQIYHYDFLLLGESLLNGDKFTNQKFDYIITNPPWGNKNSNFYLKYFNQIKSKEISSYFIVKASCLLKKNGIAKFVLPESILNISIHKDIRKYILDNMNLKTINLFGQCFSNVLSKVISLSFNANCQNNIIKIQTTQEKYFIDIKNFLNNFGFVFSLSNENKLNVLRKIYALPYLTLTNSIWGLGIVTGDNKNKLYISKHKGMKAILTGKEIHPYVYDNPKHYFNFDKEKLQQTAKNEIYLANEKLIYKFISSKLIFAYDNNQLYVLNSANILIPKVDGMSVKTVLAYLNSEVLHFVYKETFNQIKILKNNLCKLPFPLISIDLNQHINDLVTQKLNGINTDEEIQKAIFTSYSLTNKDIKIIRGQ